MLGVLGSSYTLIFSKGNAKRDFIISDTIKKRQSLADLRTETNGIPDMNRKIDELQQAIQIFDSKLPTQREVDTILQQVSQISQASGLVTKTVRPSKSDTTANYSEEPIELILSGDCLGFYQFLLDLEKLPRLTRLTQMKLTKMDNHEGNITADLILSIYFAPDLQTSAGAQ